MLIPCCVFPWCLSSTIIGQMLFSRYLYIRWFCASLLSIWPDDTCFWTIHRCQYWTKRIPTDGRHSCTTANKKTTRSWGEKTMFSIFFVRFNLYNKRKILSLFVFFFHTISKTDLFDACMRQNVDDIEIECLGCHEWVNESENWKVKFSVAHRQHFAFAFFSTLTKKIYESSAKGEKWVTSMYIAHSAKIRFLDQCDCVTVSNRSHHIALATNSVFLQFV